MQVNVKDHGATGSGIEDETPYFNDALAALPPCGGTLRRDIDRPRKGEVADY